MLKVVNMNKKGISPLVATVILIAIVIILALLLWFWYNQWILEQESKGGTELAQACSNTELQIKSSSCENISSTEWRLTFESSILTYIVIVISTFVVLVVMAFFAALIKLIGGVF